MKRILPILFTVFGFSAFLQAQTCQPDPAYTDSTGVFPMPYDATVNPDGGIKECAYIGQPFEYSFTVGVGDSISVVFGGFPLSLPLDSVVVVSVAGLPVGLSYACDQPGCKFLKNSLGCALIYGTPTSANMPGDYQLVITGKAYFPTFPFEFEIQFPGSFFPGEYRLRLLQNSTDPCDLVSSHESLQEKVNVSVNPNPASGATQLNIHSRVDGNFTFRVVDLLGQVIEQRIVGLFSGENRIDFDGSHLPNGLYLIQLQNELGLVTQKLTIQH